ncbi:MAG TPA: nuclear transport factor 2 family protein [Steroidobacteraceae bacterium]|nr:nuclear transport factor 2 family protein [Steroidobacteraceae bacterium]HRX89364.1 nuclear transport factor 2 family protein [Steroidobacteraceae bacterium]
MKRYLLPLLVLAATSCASRGTPEEEVRAVFAAAEAAAEARDTSDAMSLVADDYSDDNGFDKNGLQHFVRAYFLSRPSLTVLLRVESVEFPADDLAQATITLVVLGRESTGAGDGARFAANGQRYRVELVREDGNWRLRHTSRVTD